MKICRVQSLALFASTWIISGSMGLNAQNISLTVDATKTQNKILHAHLVMPVKPGPLTVYYPKWIPGEHGPDGPIANLTGLKFSGERQGDSVAARSARRLYVSPRCACGREPAWKRTTTTSSSGPRALHPLLELHDDALDERRQEEGREHLCYLQQRVVRAHGAQLSGRGAGRAELKHAYARALFCGLWGPRTTPPSAIGDR